MKWLQTTSAYISKVESALVVFLLLLMIALSFAQVVLRNFFYGGITWGDIGLRNMVLWIGFIGASLATEENRHITIDALTRFLSPTGKAIANVLTNGFSLLVGIVFVWASIGFVRTEYEAGGLAFLGIRFWMLELIIPLGFFMISLRFLLKFIGDIAYLRSPKQGTFIE